MTRKRWVVLAVVLAIVTALVVASGPPKPTPNRAGAAFSFAVLGDAPYFAWEEWRYPLALQDIDQNELAFVIHVGDIFWRPCTDEMYRKTLARFDALRHPVIYTPGDNEWTDCWEEGSGGFRPQERLQRIREIFYAPHPPPLSAGERTAGGRVRGLVRQAEFIENARWEHGGVLFATVDIPGSGNGMEPFPGRTPADDLANRQRTEAAAAWVREAFAAAAAGKAKAVVIGFQANADLEKPAADKYRQLFEPFLGALTEESRRFRKPVLAVHGDGHVYIVDHPLDGVRNFTRLQVPGSPRVGWVRVFVTPNAASPWAFENHVVPQWKYW
ncbi:MAG TPA: metallophosphoesterase family protein [Thermoanaerobaculia bacterium]|jgi:hypothetical protein|nr:metallophosphoesterase family protein [Thermoanaerobaculia bacterium]